MRIVNILGGAVSAVCLGLMAVLASAEVEAEMQRVELEQISEQAQCMALNIYHEARDGSVLGQRAVAMVTLNRVESQRYPDDVCSVVYQANRDSNGNIIRHQCQFSWFCDGKSDRPNTENVIEARAWELAQEIAIEMIVDYGTMEDFTEGSTMYHADWVNPYWADDYEFVTRIDDHLFYR